MKEHRVWTKMEMRDICDCIGYRPESGVFYWKKWCGRSAPAGNPAGGIGKVNGYHEIKFRNRTYKSHRIAWLIMTGNQPGPAMDHINGIKSDNRWSNLRLATKSQNNSNIRRAKNNTSGVKGVYFKRPNMKWVAEFKFKRKRYNLGLFDSIKSAAIAISNSRRIICGEFARDV